MSEKLLHEIGNSDYRLVGDDLYPSIQGTTPCNPAAIRKLEGDATVLAREILRLARAEERAREQAFAHVVEMLRGEGGFCPSVEVADALDVRLDKERVEGMREQLEAADEASSEIWAQIDDFHHGCEEQGCEVLRMDNAVRRAMKRRVAAAERELEQEDKR